MPRGIYKRGANPNSLANLRRLHKVDESTLTNKAMAEPSTENVEDFIVSVKQRAADIRDSLNRRRTSLQHELQDIEQQLQQLEAWSDNDLPILDERLA